MSRVRTGERNRRGRCEIQAFRQNFGSDAQGKEFYILPFTFVFSADFHATHLMLQVQYIGPPPSELVGEMDQNGLATLDPSMASQCAIM